MIRLFSRISGGSLEASSQREDGTFKFLDFIFKRLNSRRIGSTNRRLASATFENLFKILEVERYVSFKKHILDIDQILEDIRKEFLKCFIFKMNTNRSSFDVDTFLKSCISLESSVMRMKNLFDVNYLELRRSLSDISEFLPKKTNSKKELFFKAGKYELSGGG
jgi:hypothetical protein